MRKVLLTTDLYHPHNDPNDHWNLATMYSLARKGVIRFSGVLCDEDKPDRVRDKASGFGDPSVQSIAQMNYISGIAVPEAIGSHKPMTCEEDVQEVLSSGLQVPSANHIISVLEEGGEVDIHLCGSCRDVYLAYRMRPELFTEQVRIFLNAGTYLHQDILEYNGSVEPFSFSQMFTFPCKIMWAPCFSSLHEGYFGKVAEHANFYWVSHEDIFPVLSRQMQNYFLYMYTKEQDEGWLTYIQGEVKQEAHEKFRSQESWICAERWMWSTPGFLMSAGWNLRADGTYTEENDKDALFGYVPVIVDCKSDGTLTWRFAEKGEETNVSLFTIYDTERFQPVMAKAVKELLAELP